jgi:hypothetical protein
MSRPLAPKGGNDRVYTPPELAKQIVEHFDVRGKRLDPCRGMGAFYTAMLEHSEFAFVEWCEIDDGFDFFDPDITQHYDWVCTNPPWSQLRAFLNKSMEVADNVVFLCLVNAFFMKARQSDMKAAGFGMKEIVFVPTPAKPWPQTGFSLGAVHIQRGYKGPCLMTDKTEEWQTSPQ